MPEQTRCAQGPYERVGRVFQDEPGADESGLSVRPDEGAHGAGVGEGHQARINAEHARWRVQNLLDTGPEPVDSGEVQLSAEHDDLAATDTAAYMQAQLHDHRSPALGASEPIRAAEQAFLVIGQVAVLISKQHPTRGNR